MINFAQKLYLLILFWLWSIFDNLVILCNFWPFLVFFMFLIFGLILAYLLGPFLFIHNFASFGLFWTFLFIISLNMFFQAHLDSFFAILVQFWSIIHFKNKLPWCWIIHWIQFGVSLTLSSCKQKSKTKLKPKIFCNVTYVTF